MDESLAQYGTPLVSLDEDTVHQAKPIKLSDQVVTDKQGRRRFHGAFTGGFSAGYFNSAGSKEGWTPSTFVSSRSKRAEKASSTNDPTAYMDEEDLNAFGIASERLQAKSNYEDPTSCEKKSRSDYFTGPIPGQPVLQELLKPVNVTVGMKFLMNLGWRPGQGIGPRLSKFAKKQVHKSSNFSSSDEDEQENILFAPDDISEVELPCPKSDTFGLGYKPLQRSNVLGNNNQSLHLNMTTEKKKKVAIKGQAFGVGAFEEDDDDIYSTEDMSHYDFQLGPKEAMETKKSRWQKTPDLFLTEALEGFCISQEPPSRASVAPLPSLPRDFKPIHQPFRRRFEALDHSRSEKLKTSSTRLDSDQRQKMIGEPTVEVVSGVKKPLKPLEDEPSTTKSHFVNTFVASQDSLPSDTPSKSCPFANNPHKQARYEAYLKTKSEDIKDIFPASMTEWERQSEMFEFSRAAAFARPVSAAIACRFTSAFLDDKSAASLNHGLNVMKKNTAGDASTVSNPSTTEVKNEVDSRQDFRAAAEGCFGRLTQTQHEWRPHAMVCRRFNVPNPYPGSKCVGTIGKKSKAKTTDLFGFLGGTPTDMDSNFRVKTEPKLQNDNSALQTDRMTESLSGEVVEEDYGLKVETSGPPTIDLFKAIFQDSSDSEEEKDNLDEKASQSSSIEQKTVDIDVGRHTSEITIDDKTKSGPHLSIGTANKSDLNTKSSKDISQPLIATEAVFGRARGVFRGIDFNLLNQFQNRQTTKTTDDVASSASTPNESTLLSTPSSVKDESSTSKRYRSSSSSSSSSEGSKRNVDMIELSDDEDQYGPALPPHMEDSVRKPSNAEAELPRLSKTDTNITMKLIKKLEKKVKKAKKEKKKQKNKEKHSHKHKKKHKR